MDTNQLFLTFILLISTAFLVAVGIQLFFTLRDFRKTLKRINNLLDTAESTASEIKTGVTGVVTYFESFKSLLKTLEIVNLLTPLHDYLQRKHKPYTPLTSTARSEITHANGIHALIDKMKDVSQKKDKKFFVRSHKTS